MKVLIGNKVYDSHETPIAICLSPGDKENIRNMAHKYKFYCTYPQEVTPSFVKDWVQRHSQKLEIK